MKSNGVPFSVSSWPRAIAHVDADAFFVECERVTNPELKGKCVAVGKDRGIVTAVSYEAKKRGVKRGMTVAQAKRVCKELILLESDYEKYSLFSVKMFAILREFSPTVEEYSIDEAFMDITGLRRLYHSNYDRIALLIQENIEKRLGISVSIGVAPTKVLAKIASKLNKPHGITAIKAREIHRYIASIDIADVWGIGNNTAALLRKIGINTALEFAKSQEGYLRRYLSAPYIRIWHELRGESVMPVKCTGTNRRKSISKAKSFHNATADERQLMGELVKNLEDACFIARKHKLFAKTLILFLKTEDFETSAVKVQLDTAANAPLLLTKALKKGFTIIYDKRRRYRQTGVILTDLQHTTTYDLFKNRSKIARIRRLYRAVDEINNRFNSSAVHLAARAFSITHTRKTHKPRFPTLKIEI